MTIHHATVKSAAGKGFILAQNDEVVSATHPQTNTVIFIDTEGFDSDTDAAKEAWAICGDIVDFKGLDAETGEPMNPGWRILTPTEPGDQFIAEYALAGDDEAEEFDAATWADLLEAIRERQQAVDEAAEVEADEEDEDRGSVVPSHFKQRYREVGIRKQDNGDFLAAVMVQHCVILDGKAEVIDCEKVETLAQHNGVDYPLESYNGFITGSRGWQGRYRMTVGNMLRKRVADAGFIKVPAQLNQGADKEIPAPEAFIEKYATKKAKAAAKEATDAAADLAKA